MALILVDTSAVYALIDRDDRNHSAAKTKLTALRKKRLEPFLTNFIVAECHALLLTRLGIGIARTWLLSNVWQVEPIVAADEQRARDIIRRYVDKDFSFVDATSISIMERMELRSVFSFDRHFEQYGFALS